jgi:hypothetical protein
MDTQIRILANQWHLQFLFSVTSMPPRNDLMLHVPAGHIVEPLFLYSANRYSSCTEILRVGCALLQCVFIHDTYVKSELEKNIRSKIYFRITGFFGLCPWSGILETRKQNVLETGSVSVLR